MIWKFRSNSLIVSLVFFILLFTLGCGKSGDSYVPCEDVPVSVDSAALVNFAHDKGITPLSDTLGMYYKVIDPGNGPHPNLTSTLSVTYKGTLLNGIVFDSSNDASITKFRLDGVIAGWQLGLPKIAAGGRIQLLVPSRYAYGCSGAGNRIPSNTPIFFDVTLVSFQ